RIASVVPLSFPVVFWTYFRGTITDPDTRHMVLWQQNGLDMWPPNTMCHVPPWNALSDKFYYCPVYRSVCCPPVLPRRPTFPNPPKQTQRVSYWLEQQGCPNLFVYRHWPGLRPLQKLHGPKGKGLHPRFAHFCP